MSERTIEKLQLDGGCFVFDFTNTINNRSTPTYDYLKSYDDILVWCRRANILKEERIKQLSRYAAAHTEQRDIAFLKAMRIRETLYSLFSAIAKNKTPSTKLAHDFNVILAECFSKMQLTISTSNATSGFATDAVLLDEPLYIIVKSAYDILTREDYSRLKDCPNCGWLFIDRTKNGKRRWCDMKVCGSRVKSTRYYHRQKDETK